MMMKQLIKQLKKCKNVAVFGHQSPDGDCLGAISAISFLLEKFGANVDLFIDDVISDKFNFLDLSKINNKQFDKNKYDTVMSVDVAAERLLAGHKFNFLNFKNSIVIDHHNVRDLVGKTITYVDNTKASCCEIIYEIFKSAKVQIPSDIATFLYLGVCDDTGCFLHDNTTATTHIIASDLLKCGADFKSVNYHTIKFTSKKSFEITTLLNRKIVIDEGVGYVVLTEKLMKDKEFCKDDIGDYVNTILNLEGVKISLVVTEKQRNVFSLNFRSLKKYDVSKVAEKFNGGGHIQASGGEYRGDVKDCVEKVVFACKKAIEMGDNSVC